MAEAFLNSLHGDIFEAESAGLEPGTLNQLVAKSMADFGIDISGNSTKSVSDKLKNGKQYDYVIAVCDGASAGKCPVFPGAKQQIHWSFPDPSGFQGSEEEKLEKVGMVRDQIKNRLEVWVKEMEAGS